MKLKLIPFAAILALLSCSENTEVVSDAETKEEKSLEFEYMDTTADPKSDFYQYCNGQWLLDNPVPESETRWSSFNVIGEKIESRLRLLLLDLSQEEHEPGTNDQILADYYASFMDTVNRNDKGLEDLDEAKVLELASSVESAAGISNVAAFHHQRSVHSIFSFSIRADAKDVDHHAPYLAQGGTSLPAQAYYLAESDRFDEIRNAYKEHIANMFALSDMEITADEAASIFEFEKQLAKISRSPGDNRDDLKKYNPMTLEEISTSYPNFQWAQYFEKLGLTKTDKIIVEQPEFFEGLDKMVKTESMDTWRLYLQWKSIHRFAKSLTKKHHDEHFNFFSKTIRGKKKMSEDWKRVIREIERLPINEILGKHFVEAKYSEGDREIVNKMIDNITVVFEERIKGLDWMSDATKDKALVKLSSFVRKLAFPDKWKEFDGLEIAPDKYLMNQVNIALHEFNYRMNNINNNVDKSEWHMPPQMVNAYYNPSTNEITFPSAIMQNPFFDAAYEDAVNYARMGAVIGHELTHGFDDQGAKYDASGNLEDWWTTEDSIKFAEKTQKLIDQYNEFEVLDSVFINGKLTLGENIADFGGLTIAYYAYLKSLEGKERTEVNGFTNEQRFFIAFGQVWKNTILDERLIDQVQGDPHSPGKYRVNGTLGNMPEFFEAFDVQEGDAMRQPADKITKIW